MLNHVLDLMREFGPVSARAMFGGHGIYREGVMFALMANEKLYFKADEQSIPEFLGQGLQPFTFEFKGKPGHLNYYEAPLEAYDEPQHMALWARKGYECALRQRKTPKPARAALKKKAIGLADLRNLGPKSRDMLAKAGIKTLAQLRKLGAVQAYARTKAKCPQASLNLLWSLEGALTDRPWQQVADQDRASLLMALDDVQRQG